jgi:hypothetical protein
MPDPYNFPLRFEIGQDETEPFTLLFQSGVSIKCITDVSIEQLLIDQLGIQRDYLEKRLSTVFLDSSPVDDIGEALIGSGIILALSSSMPGLAGATLRRKGMLSSMRRSITYHSGNERPEKANEGFVTIKLFNVLAKEIDPVLIKHGILVEAVRLAGWVRLSPYRARLGSIMSKSIAGDPIEVLERYSACKVEIIAKQ